MRKNINFKHKANAFLVGVIGGTPFDTNLGAAFLQKLGIDTVPCSISQSPIEQTKLELNKKKLTTLVNSSILSLNVKDLSCLFIYCNSLSGALNIRELEHDFHLPIITPLQVYKRISKSFNKFGLIAANCQSIANIERILMTHNPDCSVIGISNLPLVTAIENGLSSTEIIKQHKLIETCQLFEEQGCECIILGCTHFRCFFKEISDELKRLGSPIKIIDPTQEMLDYVLSLNQKQPTRS